MPRGRHTTVSRPRTGPGALPAGGSDPLPDGLPALSDLVEPGNGNGAATRAAPPHPSPALPSQGTCSCQKPLSMSLT